MKKSLKALVAFALAVTVVSSVGVSAGAVEQKAVNDKKIVTYFPSWGVYQAGQGNIVVGDMPWKQMTHVQHGFFEIGPDWKVRTTDSWADYEKPMAHSPKADWDKYPTGGYGLDNPAGHFGEYKYYKQQNPNVKILISVGGWTRSGKFHELAKDPAKKKIFVQSMVDMLKMYPWLDGFDFDWEYPTVQRPSDPGLPGDQGNPAGPEDKENFTNLLKDVRAGFDANGFSNKMVTVAVGAGEQKIRGTEPDKYHQYVDYIGVMTYDFAGAWDNTTGHLAPLYANPADTNPDRKGFNTDYAMNIFANEYKVPSNKILAGSPLYSRGWGKVEPGPNGDGLFQPGDGSFAGLIEGGGNTNWSDLKKLESDPNWKKYWDPIAVAPYLYNAKDKTFYTYEDEASLKARCSYVNKNNYGGLIIWDASGDDFKTGKYTMHSIMKDYFSNNIIDPLPEPPTPDPYDPEDVDQNRVIDVNDLAKVATKYNTLKGQAAFDELCDVNKDGIVDLYDLTRVSVKLGAVTPEPPEPPTPGDTWDKTKAYNGGATVIYKGITYKAKWWTQGEEPGVAAVWEKVS